MESTDNAIKHLSSDPVRRGTTCVFLPHVLLCPLSLPIARLGCKISDETLHSTSQKFCRSISIESLTSHWMPDIACRSLLPFMIVRTPFFMNKYTRSSKIIPIGQCLPRPGVNKVVLCAQAVTPLGQCLSAESYRRLVGSNLTSFCDTIGRQVLSHDLLPWCALRSPIDVCSEIEFCARSGRRVQSLPRSFCPPSGAHGGLLLLCVPKSSFVHDLGAKFHHSHGLFALPVVRTAVSYCHVAGTRQRFVLCTIGAPSPLPQPFSVVRAASLLLLPPCRNTTTLGLLTPF
jgi:hypothetical protein